MRRLVSAFLLALVVAGPSLARDRIPETPPWERTPAGWDIELAAPDEPGPRFVMSGRVLSFDGKPLPGVLLYAYHADHRGLYAEPGEEIFGPRLSGVLRTNAHGEYRIRSIMPGQYGGPPHVHVEVWGKDLPRRLFPVHLYPDPGMPRDTLWRGTPPMPPPSTDHAGAVTIDSSGVYRCRFDLRLGVTIPVNLRQIASFDSSYRAARDSVLKRR